MKKRYGILVHGCDDSTIITKELTLKEHEFLKEVAQEITTTSTYGCMPIMLIEEVEESE